MSALAFALPERIEAHEPPAARGIARDGVRLMVAERSTGALTHAHFRDLPDLLAPGDLLVVNRSATLAAAVPAERIEGRVRAVQLRFSTEAPDSSSLWAMPYFCNDATTRSRGNIAEPATTVAGAMPLTRTSGPKPTASSRIKWLMAALLTS